MISNISQTFSRTYLHSYVNIVFQIDWGFNGVLLFLRLNHWGHIYTHKYILIHNFHQNGNYLSRWICNSISSTIYRDVFFFVVFSAVIGAKYGGPSHTLDKKWFVIYSSCFYKLYSKNDIMYLRLEFIPSPGGTAGRRPAEIRVRPGLRGPIAGTRHCFWLFEIPTTGLHIAIQIWTFYASSVACIYFLMSIYDVLGCTS